MNPEDLQEIIILDDLDTEQIIEESIAASKYVHVPLWRAKSLRDVDAIRQRLDIFDAPEKVLLLISAHAKLSASDFRYQLRGTNFVRCQLRTLWDRREPVIVYSPLGRQEFLGISVNKIFDLYAESHLYLNAPRDWPLLAEHIDSVQAVADATRLEIIKSTVGTRRSLIGLFQHNLGAALRSGEVQKIIALSLQLRGLIPEEFHTEFRIPELIERCDCLEKLVEPHIKAIQEIMTNYPAALTLLQGQD